MNVPLPGCQAGQFAIVALTQKIGQYAGDMLQAGILRAATVPGEVQGEAADRNRWIEGFDVADLKWNA